MPLLNEWMDYFRGCYPKAKFNYVLLYLTYQYFISFKNCYNKLDSYRDDMYLVETWMLSQRHQEEIKIVGIEMVTFLKSTGRIIDELENERDDYLEELNEKRIEASSVVIYALLNYH